jgi:hypothetical protein
MNDFSGTLLITDREALLVQTTAGSMTVQTPILMDTNPPTAGSTQQMMDWARAFFVNDQGLGTGSPVTIRGSVGSVGDVPVIFITSP